MKPLDRNHRLYSLWSRYKLVALPWQILPIALLLLVIYLVDRQWLPLPAVPPEVLHSLYYLPIILSGLLFGFKGGLVSAAAVALLYGSHWLVPFPLHGDQKGYWEELVLFFAFGLLIGLLVDRERMETQRRQDQEHLAILGEAAATVAHELKNPVVTIGAHILKMQRNLAPDDPSLERLHMIFQECQRVELLLKDMVHFARPITLELEPTDANALVKKVLDLVNPRAEKNRIQLSANLDAELPRVATDQTRMTQVLYNLLLNAIQASPPESLVLITTGKRKTQVQIEVSDTGCGIPDDLRSKIFAPFFSTKKDGSGMGLAVSRRIVELHQGKLICRPNQPRGTVFVLYLPVKKN